MTESVFGKRIHCSSRREEALINCGTGCSRSSLSLLTSAATFSKHALSVRPEAERWVRPVKGQRLENFRPRDRLDA
jgi:hypothetical protein